MLLLYLAVTSAAIDGIEIFVVREILRVHVEMADVAFELSVNGFREYPLVDEHRTAAAVNRAAQAAVFMAHVAVIIALCHGGHREEEERKNQQGGRAAL
jgi:hypothetical protein